MRWCSDTEKVFGRNVREPKAEEKGIIHLLKEIWGQIWPLESWKPIFSTSTFFFCYDVFCVLP